MGLDLGTKTLGISISDKTEFLASPYKTIYFSNDNNLEVLPELKQICNEYQISTIVLGFPKNMNNSIGDSAKNVLNFKETLETNLNVTVILQDERLSSVEANNIMIKGNISRNNRKKKVDGIAANIILQSYLDRKKGI